MKAVVSCLALFVLLVAATAATAQEKAKVGDVVWAEWKPNDWYHGKIAKVDGKDLHIAFDDGDKNVVDASKIAQDRVPKKDQVKVDTRVLAKFKKTRFYPGKIAKIDGVFQHCRRGVIILGDREDVAVEFTQLLFPALGRLAFGLAGRCFTKEGHRIIEKIEHLDIQFRTLGGDRGDPLRRMIGKTPDTRASNDNGDFELAHCDPFLIRK